MVESPTLVATVTQANPTPQRPAAAGEGVKYLRTRLLEPCPLGSRELVLDTQHQTSHLLQRVGGVMGLPIDKPGNRERFAKAVSEIAPADDPHILRCDEHGWDEQGPWVVCDYTGDADGVVTLERLLMLKGGSLTLEETKRALEQLMSACAKAHTLGVIHGHLSLSEVQVDRRGSLVIGLYGLRQQLNPSLTAGADEVRSIAEIGYRLATGLLPLRPLIPVEHVIDGVDESWRGYFQTALGSPGFSSAAHALAAVQGLRLEASIGTSLRDLVRSLLTPTR